MHAVKYRVLVIEQRVEVTFRYSGTGDNIQHAGAGKAVFTEEGKRRLEHTLADSAGDVLGLIAGQG